jgi:hypothetical protein
MRLPNSRRNREAQQRRIIARIARDASGNAITSAFKCGIPVTRQQGENIVRIYPDGSTEFIKKIENRSVTPDKRRYHL